MEIPGHAIPIDFNDILVVTGYSHLAGATFGVFVKTILPDGTLQSHYGAAVCSGADTSGQVSIRIDSGHLIGIDVLMQDGSYGYTDTFVEARLWRGGITNNAAVVQLLSGYTSQIFSLSWPFSPQKNPGDMLRGAFSKAVSNPAAGANFTYTVPSNSQHLIQSVRCRLVTAVTAATRRMHIEFETSTGKIYTRSCATTQIASLTYDYNFAFDGAPEVLNGTNVNVPIPEVDLAADGTIKSVVASIQATDQLSAIVVRYQRKMPF